MKFVPVKLPPNRTRRNYRGGFCLDRIEGAADPADGDRPEDWLLSGTAAVNPGLPPLPGEGISMVPVNGAMVPLPELLKRFPVEMLGRKHLARFGPEPGFLGKLLDSAIRLHLQCHPTREFARRELGVDAGKTEGYYILGHRPEVEPYIYLGFQHPPPPPAFRRAVLGQDTDFILGCFERIPVKPGDLFLVPGGLPHAIGEGILMLEIMEPTDLVVRLEFEREGIVLPEPARFMRRSLDFALSLIDFTGFGVEEVRRRCFIRPELRREGPGGRIRSGFAPENTNCFRLDLLEAAGELPLTCDGLRMLLVTDGAGRLAWPGGSLALKPYDRVLIPAAAPEVVLEAGRLAAVVARPPAA